MLFAIFIHKIDFKTVPEGVVAVLLGEINCVWREGDFLFNINNRTGSGKTELSEHLCKLDGRSYK